MFEASGFFGIVFGAIGLLFAAVGAVLAVTLLRRATAARRALSGGLSAEARVLETYVTHDSDGGSRRHVILGFRSEDGREIRVHDSSGRPRVVGDFVPVRYLPHRPEGALPADTSQTRVSVLTVLGVAFSTVFAFVGLLFAAVGFGLGWFGLTAGPADPGPAFPVPVNSGPAFPSPFDSWPSFPAPTQFG